MVGVDDRDGDHHVADLSPALKEHIFIQDIATFIVIFIYCCIYYIVKLLSH